jgi:L-glutamine-phosphate cytidylyltransferase
MKVIILAAGQGTRLQPLTNNKPKCMVELLGKPLIKHQIDLLVKQNIPDIIVAAGYKNDAITYPEIKKAINSEFDSTNMVYTLFCCEEFMKNDDLLITYGDIVYNQTVLEKVCNSSNKGISVVIDNSWEKYWSARMNDPLSDAETLKIRNGEIIELGKKPKNLSDIEGQYIGMIKISKDVLPDIINFYHALDKTKLYDGKDFNNMYMTSFIQLIINELMPVHPILIDNGWMEIDEPTDLKYTEFLKN